MERTRSTKRLVRLLSRAALFGAALLPAHAAHADPLAPGFIQQKFGLECVPDCTLCHQTTAGGYGNYRSAVSASGQKTGFLFIIDLKACGFDPLRKDATWDAAIATCEGPTPPAGFPQGQKWPPDADGDGVSDMDELKAGTDPNNGAPDAKICANVPTYGCVRVARGNSIDGLALVVSGAVLFAGIALVRRKSR